MKQKFKIYLGWSLIVIGLLLLANTIKAQSNYPKIVASKDGTQISYEVYGTDEPTLVFVHGWNCDARYWQKQIAEFSRNNRIILIDLAGHGHSGMTREKYTMKAFGEDVKAVVEAEGDENVILIGHSFGGTVIAEAARLMPHRVKGLIGVDTYENIEYPLSREEFNSMMQPFQENFQPGTRQFVQQMLLPATDTLLSNWIVADMSAAPQSIALSSIEEYLEQSISGEAAKIFDEIHLPVLVVKGDLWPVDYEANRRHMQSYEVIEIENADHFLMLNRPAEFNQALRKAIETLSSKN
ncbi:alpha/beta hydrolase [uncultured Draconibacterium sp.]|uniref:alpha/beta fold hydrolase n=1 Tax=uncultured Draconibacterium sp. TaxID=1573823 RepID=UPI002AA64831|nr:alpha/beta hydrolase [uncultured Draconibacterium sp.]